MWGAWRRKWLTHERLAVCEDGGWRWPGKTLSTFYSFWRKKGTLLERKWPHWTCCHVTSLFFKPPSQQFSRPMNQISSSDLCLTVAVACKVINHRYRAAVDPHFSFSFSPRNSSITSACVRIQSHAKDVPQHVLSFHFNLKHLSKISIKERELI